MKHMDSLAAQIQALDDAILHWSQDVLIGVSPVLDWFWIVVGQWAVYAVPIVLLVVWFWLRFGGQIKDWQVRRVALIEFTVAGLLGWQVLSRIVKAFYFRDRPSTAGQDVKELFFHRPDESFPSDHSALFFAFATYAYLLGWKRTGHWMLGIAIAVSVARIVTGTHWFTDILGGLLIGILAAYLLWWFREPFRRWIAEPVARLLEKIGL